MAMTTDIKAALDRFLAKLPEGPIPAFRRAPDGAFLVDPIRAEERFPVTFTFDPADLLAFRDHRLTATVAQERQAAVERHMRAKESLICGWIAAMALQGATGIHATPRALSAYFGRWFHDIP